MEFRIWTYPAGWREWLFLEVYEPESGVTGWSEFTESNGSPNGLIGALKDLHARVNVFNSSGYRGRRHLQRYLRASVSQSRGGITTKALAAVENAILDIEARKQNLTVSEMLGGGRNFNPKIYWSHYITSRIRASKYVGKSVEHFDDLNLVALEVEQFGVEAVKINPFITSGDKLEVCQPGFGKPNPREALNASNSMLDELERTLKFVRLSLPPKVGIGLDINLSFNIEQIRRLEKVCDYLGYQWIELDHPYLEEKLYPRTTNLARRGGENVIDLQDIYYQVNGTCYDGWIIDPMWTGFETALGVVQYLSAKDKAIYVHNFNSPLSTRIALQLQSIIGRDDYFEYDVDDIPNRGALFEVEDKVQRGRLIANMDSNGWGVEMNLNELRKNGLLAWAS